MHVSRGMVVLAFGLWIGILTAIGAAFPADWWVYVLLGSASFGLAAWGAVLLAVRESNTAASVHSIPATSWAAAFAAIGAAVALFGSPFGIWLSLPALGVFALGVAGVARELVAQRRDR